MGENLIIGFVTMAVCLAIQCVVVGALLDALVFLEKKGHPDKCESDKSLFFWKKKDLSDSHLSGCPRFWSL